MVLEGRSELGEATIKQRALEYFAGELGLEVISQTVNAISFDGDAGTVNVSISEEGPDSFVQVLTEGLDREGATFLQMVAEVAGG